MKTSKINYFFMTITRTLATFVMLVELNISGGWNIYMKAAVLHIIHALSRYMLYEIDYRQY